jgi:hypothetical protein
MFSTLISLALTWTGNAVFAQQTGSIVGSTQGARISSRMEVRKATCESAATNTNGLGAPIVPEMVFWRNSDYLVCVRRSDGHTEKLMNGGPWMSSSPDGNDIAYWNADEHKLHVFSISNHQDTVLDSLPGMVMREMVWAKAGRTLAYALDERPKPSRIHVVELDTGKRSIVEGSYSSIVSLPDREHIVVIGREESSASALSMAIERLR